MIINKLSHCFLVATTKIPAETNFHHAVIYINQVSPNEIRGTMVNKKMQITLKDLLKHTKTESCENVIEKPILLGGPIHQNQGFVIHNNGLKPPTFSSSANQLKSVAYSRRSDFIIAMGYCEWTSEKLSSELIDNQWLIAPFDPDILFATPAEQRWQKANDLLKIDANQFIDSDESL